VGAGNGKQPALWIAFFVHDLGYLGKPNMDGPEGRGEKYRRRRYHPDDVTAYEARFRRPGAIAPAEASAS
jgi:hypothetical protein